MPLPERAKPARNSARNEVGDGSPCLQPPHPQPVGSGPRPHARKDEWSGVGERPTPDDPHPGRRHPPRAPSCRPPRRAKPARNSARGGVGDRFPTPAPTPRGARSPNQVGGNGTGPPPPRRKPNGARHRGWTRGGARTKWNGPTSAQHRDRARCACQTDPGSGGESADAARAQAHTHTKNTRGKPEGQPDRPSGTPRSHGMAYQRARIRDTQTGRPATHSAGNAGWAGGNREDTTSGTGSNPPEPAASAAHTEPEHCTCQGSSGA